MGAVASCFNAVVSAITSCFMAVVHAIVAVCKAIINVSLPRTPPHPTKQNKQSQKKKKTIPLTPHSGHRRLLRPPRQLPHLRQGRRPRQSDNKRCLEALSTSCLLLEEKERERKGRPRVPIIAIPKFTFSATLGRAFLRALHDDAKKGMILFLVWTDGRTERGFADPRRRHTLVS